MSIHLKDDGSIRATGKDAQALFDAVSASHDYTVSPGYVRRQLRTMDEIILSIRDAAKAGKIALSASDRELLAGDVDTHARRVIQLALEIREGR